MNKGVVAVVAAAVGIGSGAALMEMKRIKDVEAKKTLSDKHLQMFRMMDKWVGVRQEGNSLIEYFITREY